MRFPQYLLEKPPNIQRKGRKPLSLPSVATSQVSQSWSRCSHVLKKLFWVRRPCSHSESSFAFRVACTQGLCFPCSFCPLSRPPLEEEASLFPGYNYQEGELPKPDLATVCVVRSCWDGHLHGVGSSWVAGAGLFHRKW